MIRKMKNPPAISVSPQSEPPYQRPHDRWAEIAPVALAPNGSDPKSHLGERSLRHKRAVFVGSVTAFFVGALLIVLSSPFRFEFLAPGALSSPHSQILATQGSDRCAACHEAANDSFGSWVSTALFGRDSQRTTQSQLCMKCHEQNIDPILAMKAHNVDKETLVQATGRMNQRGTQGFIASVGFESPLHQGEIACNACHREHHGDDQNLAAMTDAQCQVCHSSQFRAFEIDHPEFQNYGSKRRSRIAFDHNSHHNKHFPASSADFNCQTCHLDDDFKNVKTLASFEQGCASCHDEKINQNVSSGLVLFSLPMLDMEAFESRNIYVGSWPLAATGDFDGPLSPAMRMLLAADVKSKPVIDRLPLNFDFSDIDPDDDQAVADSAELVWAIKRLLYELSNHGPVELERRIEASMQIEVTPEQLAAISPNLDRYAFAQAVRRWLPNLPIELQIDSQVRSPLDGEAGTAFSDPKPVKPLKDFEVPGNVSWWPKDKDLLARMEATLSGPQDEDGDMLVVNPLKALMNPAGTKGAPSLIVSDSNEDRPQAVDPIDREVADDQVANVGGEKSNAMDHVNPSASAPTKTIVSYELEPATEGWVRDDSSFKIVYLPSGHADRGLVQWIDWAAASSRAPSDPGSANLFQRLVSTEGLGNCRSCHTADRFQLEPSTSNLAMMSNHGVAWSDMTRAATQNLASRNATRHLTLQRSNKPALGESVSTDTEARLLPPSLQVNWNAIYRDPGNHGFTRFSHAPHLIQPGLRDCRQCHQLDSEQFNADQFNGLDPSEFVSNFVPIRVANCSSCHAENSTSNSCTQCHHYHVGLQK